MLKNLQGGGLVGGRFMNGLLVGWSKCFVGSC
jgi:hypothetical protein